METPHITWHKCLESTNSDAKMHIDDYDNLSVSAAISQEKGRGQADHKWFATPGKNLTFTIILKPRGFAATDALFLTRITTLSLLSYLNTKGIKARIKWPNDIWVGEKKICGILIENTLDGPLVKYSLIGIGLNVNERNWPEYLPNPVSMSEITGKEYDIRAELEEFHKEFCRHEQMYWNDDGKKKLCEEFEKNVFRLSEAL